MKTIGRQVGSYGHKVGINNFKIALEANKQRIDDDLYAYISTCDDAQDIVDALHAELDKEYSIELDYLYSIFFVVTKTTVVNFYGN
jgi:hypothetical protein